MVEIVKNTAGKFQLVIKSASGGYLLQSTSFNDEDTAKKMMGLLRENPVFERITNHEGKFVIRLKTIDGECIGESNTYSSEAGMENGIKNLKKSLLDARF